MDVQPCDTNYQDCILKLFDKNFSNGNRIKARMIFVTWNECSTAHQREGSKLIK